MKRESCIYKVRRVLQQIASYIVSDTLMSKFYYRIVVQKKLNLKNPKTFNEKMQWLKLYHFPNNDLAVKCADKYSVREYIKSKGFGNKLVPLISSWDKATDIDFDNLPEKFVLKCSHGCAYNIVCSDINNIDRKKTIKQLNKWLKEDFGRFNIEKHYSMIKNRKIIAEEFLGDSLIDYKFFCFNGVPKYLYISKDLINDRDAQIGFYNLDGSKMELVRDDYADFDNVSFPSYFEDMKKMALDLCKDFVFVRVDFFIANDTYYFAELTFTPSACMMPFNPPEYDLVWGNELDITQLKK